MPEKIKDSPNVESTKLQHSGPRDRNAAFAGEIEFGVALGCRSSHGECDSEIAERNQVDFCSVRDFTELRVCENADFNLALIS